MSTDKSTIRVGWVVDAAPRRAFSFPWQKMGTASAIRYGQVARWIARHDPLFAMERYRPWRNYDIVVFVKKLNEPILRLAECLQRRGTRILFDSNVNYYEWWGDFQIPGTRPTPDQHRQAEILTSMADVVVADSVYLEKVCRRYQDRVVWIPDAVDTDVFHPPATPRRRSAQQKLRCIWSGMSKKAHHLSLIANVLEALRDRLEIHLVIGRPHPADPPSAVIGQLEKRLGAEVTHFDYSQFPADLQRADVILSPKILSSAYEMGHTEYKISLGMAVGLPALASPQPSYLEALHGQGGGLICRTVEDWEKALCQLHQDPAYAQELGHQARRRVVEKYSVPVVAERYRATLLYALDRGPIPA